MAATISHKPPRPIPLDTSEIKLIRRALTNFKRKLNELKHAEGIQTIEDIDKLDNKIWKFE